MTPAFVFAHLSQIRTCYNRPRFFNLKLYLPSSLTTFIEELSLSMDEEKKGEGNRYVSKQTAAGCEEVHRAGREEEFYT